MEKRILKSFMPLSELRIMNNHPIDLPWGTFTPSASVRCWLRLLHALPQGQVWRRLALWLRKPVKCMLCGWVDLEIWGLKLRLRSQGNLSEQRLIFMPQYLDDTERREIASILQDGGVFLDIGANAGVYSLWVSSLRLPNVRVEAFEPDPELCASLEFNLHTNSLENVRVNPLALGRSEGRMSLISTAGNKGENRVSKNSTDEAARSVEMTTLPRFLEKCGIDRIHALKIDIEGHEADALEPMFNECAPSAWPRLLICEVVHDSDQRLANLIDQAGYQLHAKGRLNGIYLRKPFASESEP